MLIGHYGPLYAIKWWQPSIPLFILFLSVRLVDVGWAYGQLWRWRQESKSVDRLSRELRRDP